MSRLVFTLFIVFSGATASAQATPSLQETRNTLKRSVDFFRTIAPHGGYVYRYSSDLSKQEGEGKTDGNQVWIEPPGTPAVGMAFLTAYELSGEPFLLDAAKEVGRCLVQGQLRSGGWDGFVEFDPKKRPRYAYRVEPLRKKARNTSTLDDNKSQSAMRMLMRLDKALGFKDASIHEASRFALDATLNAQYPNGAWLQSPEVAKFFNVDMANWNFSPIQPAALPHRKGMLTHPAWLIAHAQNTETDPIHRGKWVQEKLLAGTIPDVPITVDANVPEDPHKTMRQRIDAKTRVEYCWTCHQKMNPLGLPFEMFDDFGRYRTQERLEYPENLIKKAKDKGAPHEDLRDIYKTLPVDARGHLAGTGDSKLDGDVTDALDLIDRLAKSERVRQSIIRHAFRYFMGRNELLSDSKTLIDADEAYVESGGSFDAVIVSLLTSDSFMYRKDTTK